jgi:hypothetical protein
MIGGNGLVSRSTAESLARTYRPLDTAAYLRVRGWKQSKVVPDLYSLWTKGDPETDGYEVLLPESLSARDLPLRVVELVKALAIAEHRSMEEVVEDLGTPNCDIVRARLKDEGDRTSLPLESGVEAFRNVYDLLLAAGCAAWKPRATYGPRKPDEALRFVRDVRLGQTHPGSYVIKVVSPVAPRLTQSALFEVADEPFARRATIVLAQALQAVIEGVRKAAAIGKVDALFNAVSRGVSANLCDALAGLGRIGHGVEFDISWAAARPPATSPGEHFALPEDAAPYLEETSRWFRQTSVLEDAEFFGIVRELKNVGEDVDRVTLTGTVNGERRTVVALLEGDTRLLATQAFQERLPVTCVGEIEKEGRAFHLRSPRSFAILTDSE